MDTVIKALSIPMIAIDVVLAVMDFKNGNVFLGVCLLLCAAWWVHMVYERSVSKKP